MNPCSEHYTPAACAAANCPNAWTDYNAEVGSLMSAVHHKNDNPTDNALDNLELRSEQPDSDRGANNIGKLNAHGLAELRSIILTVIDDGDPACDCKVKRWHLFEIVNEQDEAGANAARLDFCDAIAAEIVRRAAPATAGGRVK